MGCLSPFVRLCGTGIDSSGGDYVLALKSWASMRLICQRHFFCDCSVIKEFTHWKLLMTRPDPPWLPSVKPLLPQRWRRDEDQRRGLAYCAAGGQSVGRASHVAAAGWCCGGGHRKAHMPDRRRRATWTTCSKGFHGLSLTHAGLWLDDSQGGGCASGARRQLAAW